MESDSVVVVLPLPESRSGDQIEADPSTIFHSSYVNISQPIDSAKSLPKIVFDSPLPQHSQSASILAEVNGSGEIESLVPAHNTSMNLGAWAKPLSIHPSSNSTPLSTLRAVGSNLVQGLSAWPSLSDSHLIGASKNFTRIPETATQDAFKSQASNDSSVGGLIVQNSRFPWAAKMNPQMRNLHRVTTPEYMEDGTPKVIIPNHVFLKGLENQREFVLGQFYKCSAPPGGLIHAVVNRVWGKKCRIFTRKLSESSYLFHIPDESTRSWVLQRGLWHVDDCLLFIAPWTPTTSLELPAISTIPVWVTLKNIPANLYSILGIDWIASGLGEPMLTHKPRLDPTLMGEAKILVEIELDKPFAQKIAAFDKKGNVAIVDVEYSWIPSKCEGCGLLGHKKSRCLLPPQNKEVIRGEFSSPSKVSTSVGTSNPSAPTNGNAILSTASVLIPDEVFVPAKSHLKSPMAIESSIMHYPTLKSAVSPISNAPLLETSQAHSPIPETLLDNAVVSIDQGQIPATSFQATGSTKPATVSANSTSTIVETVMPNATTTIVDPIIPSFSSEFGNDKLSPTSPTICEVGVIESLPLANVVIISTPITTDVATPLVARTDSGSAKHISVSAEVITSKPTSNQPSIESTTLDFGESIPITNTLTVNATTVTEFATTLVGHADSANILSTPTQLSTLSTGNTIDEVALHSNSFEVLQDGNASGREIFDLSGYENIDVLNERSRGGRPLRQTQKMQESQWTKVSGRRKRGGEDRGGRGHPN